MKTWNTFSVAAAVLTQTVLARIDRQAVISQFNPVRYASSNSTPMQVGNGNFAFGVDVTGLQTFRPFGILSSWGWHNFSLPSTPNQTLISDFTGLDWWTHGRLINYDQPNPAENDISNWLIQNPQRLNLGRIGFWFKDQNITEQSLSNKSQILDLYTGIISSNFTISESLVQVTTLVDPDSDTISIDIRSDLIASGKIGVFFDYPYSDLNKFDDPFVGVWNASSLHTTNFQTSEQKAEITHITGDTTYYTSIHWNGDSALSRSSNLTHRYILQPKTQHSTKLDLNVNFSPSKGADVPSSSTITKSSLDHWPSYWQAGAFIDLTHSSNPNATELQRRIVLSQYLLAVNSAGHDSPQESGLVNNGWYGKFHMEMVFWHLSHWSRWGKWSLLSRSIPGLYERFLPSSIDRAKAQGYKGARWGKMSDPTGRSAPGEINSLLIWQQPHVMYFAEMEWRDNKDADGDTLERWDTLITESADWMADFAWWNETTGVYDLGPPMYPVSENTNPNATVNPTFELAYWHFGLTIASNWKRRQGLPVPETWTHVLNNLAPLPVVNSTYALYSGIPNMWIDPVTYTDHPAMTGIYGWLPPSPLVNLSIVTNTAQKISELWTFANLYGWDFPMLAMNAVRIGEVDRAVAYLLDEYFAFDDVGMPIGGPIVPTPYFPASSSLLLAVAMMAGGWDGEVEGAGLETRWPKGWLVEAEGFTRAI